MVPQDKVDQHASRIDLLVSVFSEQVKEESELVSAAVSEYLFTNLDVENGTTKQHPENSATILGAENAFNRELSRSNFYALVLAFVSSFIDQVDEFRTMHPEFSGNLAEDAHEILGNQVAAAIGVIEGHVLQVSAKLRTLLSRSLGEVGVAELVNEVTSVIRGLGRVEQIARDQVMLWFRLFGHLVFKSEEEKGTNLLFRYAGPTDASRDFCNSLLGSGQFSRNQIASMDNGQVPDAFINCGGFGCKHFWSAEAA